MSSAGKRKKIFVLDVHASEAGALSILNDFYDQVRESDCKQFEWTFMVSTPKYKQAEHIKIIRHPWIKKTLIHRFLFDVFFINRIIKSHNPDLILNLQNKCVKFNNCPQIVYLHLPFILTNFNFSLLQHEIRLWFYQKILKKVIFNSYKYASKVIVQTSWMRDALVSQAKIGSDQVDVISPLIEFRHDRPCVKKPVLKIEKIFYPATAFSYKNHMVILQAIKHLKENSGYKISAEFTVSAHHNKYTKNLHDYCVRNHLDANFLGNIERQEVLNRLLSNGLVFPSLVESFGLPLLEARLLNVPIIAVDAPFSREILDGYDRVMFFDGDDYVGLARCLEKFNDVANVQGNDPPKSNLSNYSIMDLVKSHFNKH